MLPVAPVVAVALAGSRGHAAAIMTLVLRLDKTSVEYSITGKTAAARNRGGAGYGVCGGVECVAAQAHHGKHGGGGCPE
jgi:hypothetical protein